MIVLDIESTGTNPQVHSILSIGALDFDEPTNQFYDECRVWEGAKLEDEAFAIHGFTSREATDTSKKSETELVAAFFAWAIDRPKERTLVAQNVWFDAGFLEAAARRGGIEYPFAKRVLDVHTLAWLHMSERGLTPPTEHQHSALNSKTILAYCGLPEEAKPHNALTGALWHAEVVSRIAYTKNLLPEFSSFPIPWQIH